MKANKTGLDPGQISEIVYGMLSVFIANAMEVTPEIDINILNREDRASFDALILEIIENQGIKPMELHDNWVVTTAKMIEENDVEENNIAKLRPYMISFKELPLNMQTMYRLQVQLTRQLTRHNRNVNRQKKREREYERQRERISSGSLGVRKGGVPGRRA